MTTLALTPWPAAIVGVSGPLPALVTALRRACLDGFADLVSLELWVDTAAWQAMLVSGDWRRLPVLLSVLPVVDSALQRPDSTQRVLAHQHRVRLWEAEEQPERWDLITREAAIEALVAYLADIELSDQATPAAEARRLAADFLTTRLAPWPHALLLTSTDSWCDFFQNNPRYDLTLMALGPEGAVNTFCVTDKVI